MSKRVDNDNPFKWMMKDGWYRTIRISIIGTTYHKTCEIIMGSHNECERIRKDILKKVINQTKDRILERLYRDLYTPKNCGPLF